MDGEFPAIAAIVEDIRSAADHARTQVITAVQNERMLSLCRLIAY